MSIAFSTLMSEFLEFLEAAPVISEADAGSNATKIIDAALSIYPDGYFDADYWIYVTSGLAEGDIRRIETFDQPTTTLDPYVDFSAAVAAADDYEIHKHNPDSIKRAINDALVSIYKDERGRLRLYRKIVFTDLGHSLLSGDAAAAQADVAVADGTLFFVGQKLTIKDDNSSEDVEIESIAADTLTMTANLANAYATADNAEVYAKSGKYFNLGATIGDARVTGVFLQADSTSQRKRQTDYELIISSAGAMQIYFPTAVSVDDQTWVIEAAGRLESVSDPTDTVTIDSERTKLLYAEAGYHFYRRQTALVSAGDTRRLRSLSLSYKDMVNKDFRHLWMSQTQDVMSIKTDGDY